MQATTSSMRLQQRASNAQIRPQQHRRMSVQAVAAPLKASEAASRNDELRGLSVITAIKTPYLRSGKFDLDAYDELVEGQIKAGVRGLIIGGTTGEGHLMSWDEHIMLIAHTVNQFGRQIKVVGNTGSNNTCEAIHATEQGFQVGMHASLQINPYYGKTSVAGLREHFKDVLAEGPAIVYNVPGRTGQDIPDDVIMELSRHPNFLGVKECTGNQRIQNYHDKGVRCWSGNDDEAMVGRHENSSLGVISVTSNLVPGLIGALMEARDDATNDDLKALMSWLFSEPNPIPLNTALAMCGLIKPVFRLPYMPLSKEERARGLPLLQKFQQHIPGCQEIRVMEDSEFTLLSRF